MTFMEYVTEDFTILVTQYVVLKCKAKEIFKVFGNFFFKSKEISFILTF